MASAEKKRVTLPDTIGGWTVTRCMSTWPSSPAVLMAALTARVEESDPCTGTSIFFIKQPLSQVLLWFIVKETETQGTDLNKEYTPYHLPQVKGDWQTVM